MSQIAGLHHLALCTADMKAQIEFFTDKLGMELVALYWMHGVDNTWHGFLRSRSSTWRASPPRNSSATSVPQPSRVRAAPCLSRRSTVPART